MRVKLPILIQKGHSVQIGEYPRFIYLSFQDKVLTHIHFRIKSIAERYGVEPDTCLENITYARALNSEHQCELLEELGTELASGDYRLLV